MIGTRKRLKTTIALALDEIRLAHLVQAVPIHECGPIDALSWQTTKVWAAVKAKLAQEFGILTPETRELWNRIFPEDPR